MAATAAAQESQFASDVRREGDHLKESCGNFSPKGLGNCAYSLVTEYPFHLVLGNLAPQNGFALGLAFSERYTPNESWRLTWSADAVRSFSGSYRGGAYMKLVRTPDLGIVPTSAGSGANVYVGPREVPAIDLVGQTSSLRTINYFGQGPATTQDGRALYGERQTLVGGSVVYPLPRVPGLDALRPSLVGGINGRWVDIRPGYGTNAPSIEEVNDGASAPGLGRQDGFLELREGIWLKPSIANGHVRFNYLLSAQQFRTSRESQSSFNRWTVDLQHEIPLYRGVASIGPGASNTPNECSQTTGSPKCPDVLWSRNRQGSIHLRVLLNSSSTSGDNRVPFYFQPTLGGSDLNGQRLLAGYDDYRFRGPHLIALQEGIEHSLWGPVGVFAMAEQGKVAQAQRDLDFTGLSTSATVGLTVRAGGFPMMNFSFSWGREGQHVIGTMNSSLLGGAARPSLY